jgi:hypothetical protein
MYHECFRCLFNSKWSQGSSLTPFLKQMDGVVEIFRQSLAMGDITSEPTAEEQLNLLIITRGHLRSKVLPISV